MRFSIKTYLCYVNQQSKFSYKSVMNRQFSSNAKEQQVTIDGYPINYLQVGTGSKTILCFPGALGTLWRDFRPQIENLDRTKFTIIGWDPPGYGKSRPPLRSIDVNFYVTDADVAGILMDKINITKYSLLGWSDGGISSMILAAKRPNNVEKLVFWGSNAYVTEQDINIYESIRDLNKWSPKMRQQMIDEYGLEYFQKMWSDWCDTLAKIYKERNGHICKDLLKNITCPTFILHGSKDPMVAPEHPDYLKKHIKNVEFHVFPNGRHDVHLRSATEFNELVTKFLLR